MIPVGKRSWLLSDCDGGLNLGVCKREFVVKVGRLSCEASIEVSIRRTEEIDSWKDFTFQESKTSLILCGGDLAIADHISSIQEGGQLAVLSPIVVF